VSFSEALGQLCDYTHNARIGWSLEESSAIRK